MTDLGSRLLWPWTTWDISRLGSVAGPVIQTTGRLEFEDGLGLGDFVSGYTHRMSVCTHG
jgi:hypothetical protein